MQHIKQDSISYFNISKIWNYIYTLNLVYLEIVFTLKPQTIETQYELVSSVQMNNM